MKEFIRQRLQKIADRFEEVGRILASTDISGGSQQFRELSMEYARLQPLAERIGQLLAEGQTTVLLGGAGPDGLAVLRFRPGIWSESLECYLAELYVVPDRRGHGLGRALMRAAIANARERGADHMDLGTGEQDVVARALYESLGFSNREGKPAGPIQYFYEREL